MSELKRVDPVKGTIVLPRDVRRGVEYVEVERRSDGVIELRPRAVVPPDRVIDPDQAWFWTERWQSMEAEVEAQYAAGRGTVDENSEEFLAHLDSLAPEGL